MNEHEQAQLLAGVIMACLACTFLVLCGAIVGALLDGCGRWRDR